MKKRIFSVLLLLFLVSGFFLGTVRAEVSSVKEYNEDGNCVREMYFQDGEPFFYNNSYYGVSRVYQNNRCISISYLDAQGALMLNRSGYARVERELDDQGRVVQEMYFGLYGEPAILWDERSGLRRTAFDERGNCTEYIYLDQNGEPVMLISGYAMLRRTYNEQNRTDTNLYFDINGQPARLSSGEYGDRHIYDENGLEIWVIYLDSDGQPVRRHSGYAMLRKEYDASGRLIAEWYCDQDGNPVRHRRGQYGSRMVYQDGAIVERVPVDQNGRDIFMLDQYLQQHPWLVYAGAAAVLLLCTRLSGRWRYGLLFLYVLFILYMTLYVRDVREGLPASFVPFDSVKSAMEDGFSYDAWAQIIHNIMLFMPLGFILYAVRGRTMPVLLSCTAFSVLIEITQYFTGLGYLDVDDILWNTLGGLIGTLLMLLPKRKS